MKINYFNRNKDLGFSIARVFGIIINEVQKKAEVQVLYAPAMGASPQVFKKNLAFAKQYRDKSAINHITGDVNYLTVALKGYNCVVTVHDIGLMKRFKGLKKALWNYWWIQTLKKADRVTFISEYTKNEVLKYVNLPEWKTVVVPNPLPVEFTHVSKEFNTAKPVLLHMGTGTSKNLPRTIVALKGINCHLRIIGKISSETVQLLKENEIDYSNAVNLTDQEVLQEYINCDVVSFPSIHEGFGMPILEGQAVGRVVLTSDMEPMNNVCGPGGAHLTNPFDTTAMHNSYKTILADAALRGRIIQAGLENVKNYSAEAIAGQYMKVYAELIK